MGNPILAQLRDENWPTKCPRSWLREAIDEKER